MRTDSLRHIDALMARAPALEVCIPSLNAAAEAIIACHGSGGKVLLCGNGGSASDADHIVGELAKSFAVPRPVPDSDRQKLVAEAGETVGNALADKLQQGICAVSLAGLSALATAVMNDIDPELVYAQLVYAYGRPGDVLIGISTSGNARNVAAAMTVGRALGLFTISLTGARPSKMEALSDIAIKAPAQDTFLIQEYHLPLYHTLCMMVETELYGGLDAPATGAAEYS